MSSAFVLGVIQLLFVSLLYTRMPDLGLEDHDDFDFCIIIKVCLSCDFGEASRCL
jgi:hypothetical protein